MQAASINAWCVPRAFSNLISQSVWLTPDKQEQSPADDNGLQILRAKPGVLGDTREHARAEFFVFMKGENHIRPTFAGQGAVGTGLALEQPSELQECSVNTPGF